MDEPNLVKDLKVFTKGPDCPKYYLSTLRLLIYSPIFHYRLERRTRFSCKHGGLGYVKCLLHPILIQFHSLYDLIYNHWCFLCKEDEDYEPEICTNTGGDAWSGEDEDNDDVKVWLSYYALESDC